MSRLDIHLGGRRIIECPVREREVTIGRSPNATISLPDAEISRVHARIRYANGRHEILDQSINGTIVDGQDISGPQPLRDGSTIRIGSYQIIYSAKDSAIPAPTSVNIAFPTRLLRCDGRQVTCSEARLEVSPPGKTPPYQVTLPDRPVNLGKSPACDIVLTDEFVSRVHARLVPVADGWRIEDLGSRNGTRINGRETGAALLASGDRIQTGQTRLQFHQKVFPGTLDEDDGESGREIFAGNSASIVSLRKLAARIAPSNAPVLVLGETGTGKEQYARLLHLLSGRSGKPFVAVNCGALPENLVESELFGHERGAFTGAEHSRAGLFVTASEGTLFLDEIADLSLQGQVKFLRAIESGEVRPVGATAPVIARPRIIAATHADLLERVRDGRFREDLFHRLNVIAVQLPPLKDRASDIEGLAAGFLESGRTFTPEAIQKLRQHSWPGNVRELRNVVERSAILCPDPDIGPSFVQTGNGTAAVFPGPYLESHPEFTGKTLDEIEAEILRRVLADAGGIQARAARLLGLSRGSLHGKLTRHGIISRQENLAEPEPDHTG